MNDQVEKRAGTSMSVAEVAEHIERAYGPISTWDGDAFAVEDIGSDSARVRMRPEDRFLRPGGTISGPTMFFLADVAVFVAIIGACGPVDRIHASGLNINYLRPPAKADMIAEARLIKRGRRLVVAEVQLWSSGHANIVAHATATYRISI